MMEKLIKNLNQKKQPKKGVINISKKGRASAHKLFYTSYIIQDIYLTSYIIQVVLYKIYLTSYFIQVVLQKIYLTSYIIQVILYKFCIQDMLYKL